MSEECNFFWLNSQYYRLSTDASPDFAEAMAYSTLGHCLGRSPMNLIQPYGVYHNSYILLEGESSSARKTTSHDLAMKYFPQIRLIYGDSPEGFVEALSRQPEGYGKLGELSIYMKASKKGDYKAGFVELWNDLHSCQKFVRKLRSKKGEDTSWIIPEPYLSLSSTLTEQMLHECVTSELAYGGWLPRWFIVKGKNTTRDRGYLNPKALMDAYTLGSILNHLCEMEKDADFVLSKEALQYYNDQVKEWHKKYPNIDAYVERYSNYWIAFADLRNLADLMSAAMEKNDFFSFNRLGQLSSELVDLLKQYISSLHLFKTESEQTVQTQLTELKSLTKKTLLITLIHHLQLAQPLVEKALEAANDLVRYVELWKPLATVRNYLQKHLTVGQAFTRSYIMTMTNRTSKEMDDIEATLFERKEIIRVPMKDYHTISTDTKGGAIGWQWLGPQNTN